MMLNKINSKIFIQCYYKILINYVHNNLRSLELIKQYCKQEKIKELLVGVDARKAFDIVDHEYMFKVLEAYGFGPKFINWVKLLNKNLKAETLVNGYFKYKG